MCPRSSKALLLSSQSLTWGSGIVNSSQRLRSVDLVPSSCSEYLDRDLLLDTFETFSNTSKPAAICLSIPNVYLRSPFRLFQYSFTTFSFTSFPNYLLQRLAMALPTLIQQPDLSFQSPDLPILAVFGLLRLQT